MDTHTDHIIFEHPLNERVRNLLRLEHLFLQAQHHLYIDDIWSNRIYISTVLDMLELFSRNDFRGEILKELDRSTSNLNMLMNNPGVAHERLESVLKSLELLTDSLQIMDKSIGSVLKNDALLSILKRRSATPGGACDFEVPVYNLWLHGASSNRKKDKEIWFQTLDSLRSATQLVLEIIRNSVEEEQVLAVDGSYTQQLDSKHPYQLLRIFLDCNSTYYPEISGSKHRFSIRFLHKHIDEKSDPINQDITFKIAVCRI